MQLLGRAFRRLPDPVRRRLRRVASSGRPGRQRIPWLKLMPLIATFPSCVICGSSARRPLYITRKRLVALGCERCGVVEAFPRPPAAEVAAFYESEAGWERNKAWPEGETLEEFLERRREAYRPEIDLLCKSLSASRSAVTQPSVLDFGCGLGVTLDVFAERGWTTAGIEPAPQSGGIASQRHMLLEELPTAATYDLIVAAHVFEHLSDPLAMAKQLFAALRPGGEIYVGVPNLDRLAEHGLFRHLLNQQHLFAYTFPAIRSLLERAGFVDVRLLAGETWDPIRDSVRSLRTLSRRPTSHRARLRRPPAPRRAPLDTAIRSLADYARTPTGRHYLSNDRMKVSSSGDGVVDTPPV